MSLGLVNDLNILVYKEKKIEILENLKSLRGFLIFFFCFLNIVFIDVINSVISLKKKKIII